jgi:CRISPR-associated protein Cmr3
MEIKIQPLDTLFFRDGKPFEKGENTWADGMMLPNPTE